MFAVGKSSVQGRAILADCRGEVEGILIKNKKAKSCTNGKIAKGFPLWRERGDDDKVLAVIGCKSITLGNL